MNRHAKHCAACWLLLLGGLAGCRHRQPPPAPPVAATAPPLTASSITVITPLPSVPPERKADVQQAPPEQPKPAPAPVPVKRSHRRHRKPAVPAAEPAQAGGTTGAAGASPAAAPPVAPTAATPIVEPPPASVSNTAAPAPGPTTAEAAAPALGELSAGTAISGPEKVRMLGEIQMQETRLSKIKEPSTSDGKAVEMQVHAFLMKARQAVAENDLDGAQTLNTKARVLLDELESE